MRPSVLTCVALLLAAGCLGNDGPNNGPDPGPPADLASVFELEHDHTDPVLHATTWGFEVLTRDALTGSDAPAGIAGEIDVANGLAAVHVQGARSGFALLDVSDPASPAYLSFFDASAFRPFEARDVKLDPAGAYAYLALQLSSPDAPGGGASSGGFVVVDVKDPSSPVLVGQAAEAGRGCHMIRYWEHAGERVVYCASSQGLSYYAIEETPAAPRTPVKAGTWVPPDAAALAGRTAAQPDPGSPLGTLIGTVTVLQPHDMTAQLDPLTDAPVLAAAYEVYGAILLDITDPLRPTPLGTWKGEGAEHFDRIHTAAVYERDGRRIVLAVTEPFGLGVGAVFVVDMTEPAAPELLAEWNPPDDAPSHGGLFSTHNFQLVEDTLVMAHFHGGLWAFDLSSLERVEPTGLFHAMATAHDEGTASLTGAPSFWDVVVVDGYVLASDMPSGLVVLTHPSLAPGTAALDSFV